MLTVPIAESVRLGQDVQIFHPTLVNLYGCTVGDGSRIGAFVEIQKNATVVSGITIGVRALVAAGAVALSAPGCWWTKTCGIAPNS
jgi:UDP-3-O-[3-hydroxymyristoyl] glucosamine N-acyltransferase